MIATIPNPIQVAAIIQMTWENWAITKKRSLFSGIVLANNSIRFAENGNENSQQVFQIRWNAIQV
ncbi:MAG: hypothetical protein M3O33_18135, partial [Cyanobacteriota bacterium]|nr:hypothetical protein [Cyanobacteriota bacterium]